MKRGHFIVRGLVQGVGYRMYTINEACKLGVTGWVRNLDNGDVEIVAEGEESDLKALETWCWKGPPSSEVSDVLAVYSPATGEFKSFGARHSWA